MSAETMNYLTSADSDTANIVIGGVDGKSADRTWWADAEMRARGADYRTPKGNQLFWDGFIPVTEILDGPFGFSVLEIVPELNIDGEMTPMENYKAIVRNDTRKTLGVFRSGYEPHQPHHLVELANNLTGGEAGYTSAGRLKGGAVLWLEVSLNSELHNDKAGFGYTPNLLISTSFNGTLVTDVIRTAKFSVCDNTWDIARAAGVARVAAKHTRNSLPKLSSMTNKDALGILSRTGDEIDAEINRMIETEYTAKQFANFMDLYVPMPEWKEGEPTNKLSIATKKRDILIDLITDDPRVSPWKGTELGILQMVNTFGQHASAIHGKDDKVGARIESNMLNTLNRKIGDADRNAMALFHKALQMA